MAEDLCHCGRPLHYASEAARRMVDQLVKESGPTVRVTVEGRTWLVPRHWIALHGLTGDELPGLGFEEVQ